MSTILADRVEELTGLAQGAARRVAGSWPGSIEAEDLAQEIILHLLARPGALDRIFEEGEITRKAFMVKVAHQTASEMFQDYERFSGNYTYDVPTVRGLLERGALTAEPDVFVAEIADVREGVDNLAKAESTYYAEIINRYVHDIVPDPKDSAAKMRLSRAVEALTAQMNRIGDERRRRYIGGPGSRVNRSNRSGYVEAIVDWQGDYGDGRH